MKTENKLRVLAEMDGYKVRKAINANTYAMFPTPVQYIDWKNSEEEAWKMAPPYLTSYDTIIPLVVKWCGDDILRWSKLCVPLELNMKSVSNVADFVMKLLKQTPEQLSDALIKAAGKWEDKVTNCTPYKQPSPLPTAHPDDLIPHEQIEIK